MTINPPCNPCECRDAVRWQTRFPLLAHLVRDVIYDSARQEARQERRMPAPGGCPAARCSVRMGRWTGAAPSRKRRTTR